jgi:hypothetical protein
LRYVTRFDQTPYTWRPEIAYHSNLLILQLQRDLLKPPLVNLQGQLYQSVRDEEDQMIPGHTHARNCSTMDNIETILNLNEWCEMIIGCLNSPYVLSWYQARNLPGRVLQPWLESNKHAIRDWDSKHKKDHEVSVHAQK